MSRLFVYYFIAFILLQENHNLFSDAEKAVSKSAGPPSFFLQDPNDGLCLAGAEYTRCGIDTLWYVHGKPGSYQLHKKGLDDKDSTSSCLVKSNCHLDASDIQIANCNHCGAKKWNILGDSDTGYVLTENSNKNCIKRDGLKVLVSKCDKGYSSFNLQFASKDDIALMNSDGARFIAAAADNDIKTIKEFMSNKIDINSRDWDNMTAIMAASGKGHLNIVKLLVNGGGDVNLYDKDNITALMEASMGGHKDVVSYLCDSKADLQATSSTGLTALWMASSEGKVDVVDLLIKKGSDTNVARNDGISALMAASAGGHISVVQSLLKAKADVNAKDKDNLTALISASENGTVALVKMLIDNKADINAISDTGFSPLIVSAAHGHFDVVQILLSAGANLEPEHPENVSPLMYAAAGGFPNVVKLLIKQGANVNRRHKQGGSALMEASTSGNVTVIKDLLDAGADPFIVDEDGITPIMSSSSQGHLEVTKLLLEKKIDVNAVAKSGGTALMFSAGGGHHEVTKLLISAGADVNIPVNATPEYIEQVTKAISSGKDEEHHKNGVTALSIAAAGGFFETVKVLVEAGANISSVDDDNLTPLLSAVKAGFQDIAIYLLDNGANPNDSYLDEKGVYHNLLMDSIVLNKTALALNLIKNNANISYADSDGITVFTQAAYVGLDQVVDTMILKGVNVTISNKEGINSLIAAASEGHASIVKMLLACEGTDPNANDKDGTNALMAASVRGHKEVVRLLLENKALVNAQNVDGHTALMFAYNGKNQIETLIDKYSEYIKDENDMSTKTMTVALQSHKDVVSLLLQYGADPNIKDLEGHVASDFDYKAPDITLSEGSIVPDKDSVAGEL